MIVSACAFTPKEHIGKPPPFSYCDDAAPSFSSARDANTVLFDFARRSDFVQVKENDVVGFERFDFEESFVNRFKTEHPDDEGIRIDRDAPVVEAVFADGTTADEYDKHFEEMSKVTGNYFHTNKHGYGTSNHFDTNQHTFHTGSDQDDTPTVQAVFCGYKTSPDDYHRLRSANPEY